MYLATVSEERVYPLPLTEDEVWRVITLLHVAETALRDDAARARAGTADQPHSPRFAAESEEEAEQAEGLRIAIAAWFADARLAAE